MASSVFTESVVESTALSDALLPKLISGGARLKDAEKLIERVV